MRKSGIYIIKCIISDKVYIGKSIDILKRKQSHFNDLRKGTHNNSYLQRSFNKHKEDNFTWNLLELCETSELSNREDYYCKLYDSHNRTKGFNIKLTEERGYNHAEETKIRIGDSNRGNQAGLGKPKSDSHRENMRKAAIIRGVSDACRKASKEELKTRSREFYKYMNSKSVEVSRVPVNKYTREDILLNNYRSVSDAAASINSGSGKITECCQGKRKTVKGFIFKYVTC